MISGTVVIGGTGFIGSRLVERLAARGDEVVIVSRTGRWPWGDPPKGAHWVAIDITNDRAKHELARVLSGTRRIVNLAGALYKPGSPPDIYRKIHVNGTRSIVAALAQGRASGPAARLIHVSTTGVLGPTGKTPRDEETPPHPTNEYERTKLEGERIALSARNARLKVAVARPGLVYGPRDLHLLAWFKAIRDGRFRAIGGGTAEWQPIHVDDVARGIEALLDDEDPDGQIVHIAGSERISVKEFAGRIADELGADRPTGSIPTAVALVAGAVLELLSSDPPLSRSRVKTLTQDRVYVIERAKALLGFRPEVLLGEGLRGTVAWYRAQGLLR